MPPAALAEDEEVVRVVQELCADGFGDDEISEELKNRFGTERRGFSSRTIRRVRSELGVHRTVHVGEDEHTALVQDAVRKLGPNAGVEIVKGLLRGDGTDVGYHTVRKTVKSAFPEMASGRKFVRSKKAYKKPGQIRIPYFGRQFAMDQNEVLVRYGIYLYACVDSHARKYVFLIHLERKNAIEIYERGYRPALLELGGFPDTLRADFGKEASLVQFVQCLLAPDRLPDRQHLPPVQCVPSTSNTTVERPWREVNLVVLEPLWRPLQELEMVCLLDVTNPVDVHGTATILGSILPIRIQYFVSAMNNRRIPGPKGTVPEIAAKYSNCLNPINPNHIPDVQTAVNLYPGTLTEERSAGIDPLAARLDLQNQRSVLFAQACPQTWEQVNDDINIGNAKLFKEAVLVYIRLTKVLASQL